MTSVYGDLILQDGAKIIDKSGNTYGGIQRFFPLTIRTSTSPIAGYSFQVKCMATIYNKKVRLDIFPTHQTMATGTYTNAFFIIEGIPTDLLSKNPIIGMVIFLTTGTSGKGLLSTSLNWSGTTIISDAYINVTNEAVNISQFSIFYDL
ncbi:hypothetical protein ACTFIR_012824 [Dictyostelium discoideum]